MKPSNGNLKPDPQGARGRRSPSPRAPSPRAPEGDDAKAAEKPSPDIAYRVKTPGQVMHDAIGRKDIDAVARIIRASPDCVDVKNDRGRTPLHVAAHTGQNDIVKLLISKGAEVNARSRWNYTPLIFATEDGHHDVVVTLLDSGADLEAVTKDGHTPLFKAVLRGRKDENKPDLLVTLLIRGANCNALNKDGLTVLQRAMSAGKLSNTRVLCAFGADPSFKNPDGKDAFDFAKTLEKDVGSEMADILSKWERCGKKTRNILSQLSQFIQKDGHIDASAMLLWAAREGQALLVEFILDFMAKETPEIVESEGLRKGWRPIHHAAFAGQRDVAEILLAHGAAVDARTGTQKWTPLHLAAGKGRQRTVRVLLNNRADILAVTEQAPRWVVHDGPNTSEQSTGVTAFWLTAVGRHPKSLDILLEYALRLKDDKSHIAALGHYEKARDHLAGLSDQDEKPGHDDDKSTKPDSEVESDKSVPSVLPGIDVSGANGSFDGAFFSVPATR